MNIRDRVKDFRRVKASDLVPSPKNPREHPATQKQALAAILEEVGFAGTTLTRELPDGRLMLIDGHLRQELDPNFEIPCLVTDLTEDEADKLMLVFDPISAMALTSAEKVKALLANMKFDTEGMRKLAGELAEKCKVAMMPLPGQGGDEFDTAAALDGECRVKPGDLWLIDGGKHRLLCGDSGEPRCVGFLIGREQIDCVLTDPPYGQNQDGVTNDEPAKLANIIAGAVENFPASAGIAMVFQSPRTFPVLLDSMRGKGWKFERMLWLYKVAQIAYPWRGWILISESILAFSRSNAQWVDVHPYQHDIYRLPEVSGELPENIGWHGSVKPLVVVRDILSRIGGNVYDPFLGSGTTIIAAHRLSRRCFGLELEPKYCEVILRRCEAEGLAVEKG